MEITRVMREYETPRICLEPGEVDMLGQSAQLANLLQVIRSGMGMCKHTYLAFIDDSEAGSHRGKRA